MRLIRIPRIFAHHPAGDIDPTNHALGRLRHRTGLITGGTVTGLLTAAARAHAQTTHVVALVGSINDVLTNIQVWLTGLLVLLATVALIFGGVRYLAASTDPGEVEKAKQAFKNAGKGYLLAALAPVVVEILRGFVGA